VKDDNSSTYASQMLANWTKRFDILRTLSQGQSTPKELAVPFILRPAAMIMMTTASESSLPNNVDNMSASDAFKSKAIRQAPDQRSSEKYAHLTTARASTCGM